MMFILRVSLLAWLAARLLLLSLYEIDPNQKIVHMFWKDRFCQKTVHPCI